jgi:integrase
VQTGLTDVDAARIAAAISAARAESTRTVYAHAWRGWQRWCDARGRPALPDDPLALCAYLTERAESGRAMGTLDMSCTAIRHVHRMCGAEDPVAAEAVRQVRLGLRRTHGSAPRRLARPLSVEEIRQILGGIDRTTPIGIRDAAIILLGYASAMRCSEIVALSLADVEHKPAGLLLNVRKSKTDQEGHGEVVAVAHGQYAATDPLAAVTAWRAVRGETPGALFTRIWASSVSLEPLSGHVVARMLRARAEAVGLDGTRITAHSLRAGHATTAALAGVPPNRIAAQTLHMDISVLVNRYIRPLEVLATTSSKDLGL